MTNPAVSALVVNLSGHIFAGTAGSGVFRSVRSTTSIKGNNNQMPSSFELSQNYPNPFNSKTNIAFALPVEAKVSLKIYNVLGNEIVTLVDEFKLAGNYTVPFNISNLSSGIYFYKIEAGEFSSTKKLVLMK